jgi:hypothetical protein
MHVPNLFIRGADVGVAPVAGRAARAGHDALAHHQVPHRDIRDPLPHRFHPAAPLMAWTKAAVDPSSCRPLSDRTTVFARDSPSVSG